MNGNEMENNNKEFKNKSMRYGGGYYVEDELEKMLWLKNWKRNNNFEIDKKLIIYGYVGWINKNNEKILVVSDEFERRSKGWLWENLKVNSLFKLKKRINSYGGEYIIKILNEIDRLIEEVKKDRVLAEYFRDEEKDKKVINYYLKKKEMLVERFKRELNNEDLVYG